MSGFFGSTMISPSCERRAKPFFHDKRGQGAALAVIQHAAAARREIEAGRRQGRRQLERLGTGCNQRSHFPQIIKPRNDFGNSYSAFDYIDDFMAQVAIEAKQHTLFRLACRKKNSAAPCARLTSHERRNFRVDPLPFSAETTSSRFHRR